ncbi:toxin VasX [Pseudomonas syringae]|uniref:toxin VasX n=1 Tax=Pseudomonas syringae TaxID=317 RepID=UPI0004173154|nr:toxin VasX [Pseudomonas syringae]
MSNRESHTAIIRLADADRAASTRPHDDINSPVASCPASQAKVFVVPVRYALAEQAATHSAFQPGVTPQSHAMAARQLRGGFLYVWQRHGPLQRCAVSAQGMLEPQALADNDTAIESGSLSGLALDKRHETWLLYTEQPLDVKHCARLSERKVRQQHMRAIDLREVADALHAPHCPPLSAAEQVIAELIPDTFAWAVTIDQRRNGELNRENTEKLAEVMRRDPSSANINAYVKMTRDNKERESMTRHYPDAREDDVAPGAWSTQPWEALRTQAWLENTRKQAQGLWSVFACLDDDLGVLRDINHEQEQVEIAHARWQEDHNLHLGIGGFIRTLVTEEPGEVASLLKYRYRERDIQITTAQGQLLLDASQRVDELNKEAVRVSRGRGRQYSREQADRLIEALRIKRQEAVEPVKSFIPADLSDEVESVVREYRKEKVSNLENHHVSAKVGEYIDLPLMNAWLDQTAPDHYQRVEARHTTLYADRSQFLKRHQSGTWFVDYTNPAHRSWLDELAMACLSAQCVRSLGAEQYAEYVRSADSGALRQLFFAWSPTLEGALNSKTRLGELLAALSLENQDNARQAMAKVLEHLAEPILSDMSNMARDATGVWSTLVKRLGAALLLLKSEHTDRLSGAWTTILMAARLGNEVGTRVISEGGTRLLQAFGPGINDFVHWVKSTAHAISIGQVARIVNSPAVQNSGGLAPMVVLLLNTLNTNNYLNQASALEEMDEQRVNDTASAVLYWGAALVAVLDSQVRKGMGINQINLRFSATPTLTVFGGIIGGLSAVAAFKEFKSLSTQLENSQSSVDPWLKIRKSLVGGQVAAYGAQAIVGIAYTSRALLGIISVDAATAGFMVWMSPIIWIIALLGVLYLIAWYLQQTPLQNFLSNCCWSRQRAHDQSPISQKRQMEELDRLYLILYAPRISFTAEEEALPADNRDGITYQGYIKTLTIDLPGATPNNIRLDLSMIGDPMDYQLWLETRGAPGLTERPHTVRNMGAHWLRNSTCEWIPAAQGQGLRLTGVFKRVDRELGSLPRSVSLLVRYGTPFTALYGVQGFIGGARGLAFTVTTENGVIALRNDPTPKLDGAQVYKLGEQQCSVFLQPGIRR